MALGEPLAPDPFAHIRHYMQLKLELLSGATTKAKCSAGPDGRVLANVLSVDFYSTLETAVTQKMPMTDLDLKERHARLEREFNVRLEIASVMIQRRVRGIYFRRKIRLATKAAMEANTDDPTSEAFLASLKAAWRTDEGNKRNEEISDYWINAVVETKAAFTLDALKQFRDAMVKMENEAVMNRTASRRLSVIVKGLVEQNPLRLNASAIAKAQSVIPEGDEESADESGASSEDD